jgi:hypothetical protein
MLRINHYRSDAACMNCMQQYAEVDYVIWKVLHGCLQLVSWGIGLISTNEHNPQQSRQTVHDQLTTLSSPQDCNLVFMLRLLMLCLTLKSVLGSMVYLGPPVKL